MTPNFTFVSEVQSVQRRDFPLLAAESASDINPYSARPLVDGEWLQLDTSNSYTLKRGGANGLSGIQEGTNPAVYPLFVEQGRYDVQAIQKVTVIYGGMWEADTVIMSPTSLVVGSYVTVQDVLVGAIYRRGLAILTGAAASGVVVVGWVTRLFQTGGTTVKIRVQHMANHPLL